MIAPGKHGSLSSSELEAIICRNSQFLAVRRAGSGDGIADLRNSITGESVCGIGGGRLPEYSRMLQPAYDCACTPGGICGSGYHGINLVRGWRNILYELVARRFVSPTKEIRRCLGDGDFRNAIDYGTRLQPMNDPFGLRRRY